MRDGRLIRATWPSSYTLINGTLLATRVKDGVALTPLGSRTRYIDFGEDALEERNNDKTRMYLR